MGLEAFKVAPDNNGGRKKKQKTEEEKIRDYDHEEAYHAEHGENFWKRLWLRYNAYEKPLNVTLAEISKHAAVLPRTAVEQIQEHGIHDFENDAEDNENIAEYLISMKRAKERRNNSRSGGSGGIKKSGGLANLVSNAK